MTDEKIKIKVGAEAPTMADALKKINDGLTDTNGQNRSPVSENDIVSVMNISCLHGRQVYIFEKGVPEDAIEDTASRLRGSGVMYEIPDRSTAPEKPKEPSGLRLDIQKALDGIDMEKIISERVTKAIEDAVDQSCKYGQIKKAVSDKIESVIVPALENIDFDAYVSNLNTVLSELSKETSVRTNNRVLKNFKTLVASPVPENREITLGKIFDEYVKYAAECVDPGDLEENCEDESYDDITCVSEGEHIEKETWSDLNRVSMTFSTNTANGDGRDDAYGAQMDIRFELERWDRIDPPGKYTIRSLIPPALDQLSRRSSFECFLMALERERVRVIVNDKDLFRDERYVTPNPEN